MNLPPSVISNRGLRCALVLGLFLSPGLARADSPSASLLANHIEETVPALLEESGVPGVAVGLIHEGRIVYLSGFGSTSVHGGRQVTPQTVFNVGSISKMVTAWGAMSLIEHGAMNLETPATDLVSGWSLPDGSSTEGITIERLMAHTSGLSTPSVPEYLPWEELTPLRVWLGSDESGVRLATPPGESWSYSGAGYSLLQLAMEEASGEGFEELMNREVLEPLGMISSSFGPPVSFEHLAHPHEGGSPIPYRRYSGQAAAGLYTSLEDLAEFLAAHTAHEDRPAAGGVVSEGALGLMRTSLPVSLSPYGTAYGLGYSIWPLPSGRLTSGHRGQNHGWAAVAWLSADGRDGLVVLTNDSDGENVYRWLFCDWARWLDGEVAFGRYCSARQDHAAGSLFKEPVARDSVLTRMIRRAIPDDGPGVSALVARKGEILLREAFGLADLESGWALTPTTPFYIASLAKPLTASVVLDLVARGVLALDDPVASLLPDFPNYDRPVTVRQLLYHTSGTPDFWDIYDWNRPVPFDNRLTFQRVGELGEPQFPPGTRFEYNNTGWMGLASLTESATGRSFSDLLLELVPSGPSSSALFVLDEPDSDLPQRARGYGLRDGQRYLSDYRRLELPGRRAVAPHFSIVGAGGIVANVDGLYGWALALLGRTLLSEELARLMVEPGPEAVGIDGFSGAPLAGMGLFLSDFGDRQIWWHDGNLFGHQSIMVIEPESETVVILLTNSRELQLMDLAQDILTETL